MAQNSRFGSPSGLQCHVAETVVRGACHHDCPDTCAWEVTVRADVAIDLRGSTTHPLTRGTLCPKVNRFLDRVYHPERIRQPLRRVGPKGSGDYEPIPWSEAITAIADRMSPLIGAGRSASILQFSFAGTQGVVQMGVMLDRLFDRVGASDVHRELCGATAWEGAAAVLGTPFGIDPQALRHARTLVLWGTNTRITNRHLWPVIEQARADGAVVIVVDPVRTDTARHADVHLQLRPGSDVALVLGLVHVLARDGLLDEEWIEARTTGWPELQESSADWNTERTSIATGVAAEHITWLAHRMATAQPMGLRSLIGLEHRENGREIVRAVSMLPALLGSWRQVGGGLARSTQGWQLAALNLPTRTVRPAVNMARLGQVLTNPQAGDPHVEVLFVHNSNPAVILPDQEQVLIGLSRPDLFTVVVEQFLTDTARYADIVLPATTQVEHLDLAPAWGHLYLALNTPAIAPVGTALPNSEIARRLAAALGIDDPLLNLDDEAVIRLLLDSGHPFLTGITYERLVAEGFARLAVPADLRPHVDPIPGLPVTRLTLGALDPTVGSETVDGSSPLRSRFPLALITRKQHIAFLNTSYGGFTDHQPKTGEPVVQIHPADARDRGIVEGARVRVHNDRGTLTMAASLSTDLQPGLVAMPFGWWNGSTPEGRAANALTNARLRDDDRGSAFFHDTLVEITLVR